MTQLHTKWPNVADRNMLNWFVALNGIMNQRSFELGLIVMWVIWNNRNAAVHNGDMRDCQNMASFVMKYYNE